MKLEYTTLEPRKHRVSAEVGDLALVEPRKSVRTLILGVISELDQERAQITLNLPLKLHQDIGGIKVAHVFPLYRGTSYGGDYSIYLGTTQYNLGVWLGQKRILRELRSREGFEMHVDWISKLTKPYFRGEEHA